MGADPAKKDNQSRPPRNLSETDSFDPESRDSDLEERSPTGSKSTAVLLFMIAADTTWRMFVPIIGGTALGIWADRSFGTKPVWTVTGIGIGVVIAALLVRQQLKRKPDVI